MRNRALKKSGISGFKGFPRALNILIGGAMFCIYCGTEIPDKARFCYKCGEKVEISDKMISTQYFSETPTDVHNEQPINERRIYTILGREVGFEKKLFEAGKIRKMFARSIEKCIDLCCITINKLCENDLNDIDNLYQLRTSLEIIDERYINILKKEAFKVVMANEIYDADWDDFSIKVEPYTNPAYESIRLLIKSIEPKGETHTQHYDDSTSYPKTRMRFVGGGFGVSGAIKGAVTAAAINTAIDAATFAAETVLLSKQVVETSVFSAIDNAITRSTFNEKLKNISSLENKTKIIREFSANLYASWEGIINNTLLYINDQKGEEIYVFPYDNKGKRLLSPDMTQLEDKYIRMYQNIDNGYLKKEEIIDTYIEALTGVPFFEDTFYRIISLDSSSKDEIFKLIDDIGDDYCNRDAILLGLLCYELDKVTETFIDDDGIGYDELVKDPETRNAYVMIKAIEIADYLCKIDFPKNYVLDLGEFKQDASIFLDVVEINPISCSLCYVNNSIFTELIPEIEFLYCQCMFGYEYCYDYLNHPHDYSINKSANGDYAYKNEQRYIFD